MPARLPLTVWRYVLADLWRLVLLTAAVLVTVLAFAAAVKFLADGKLGPLDTLKFMLIAMVPMLQYALPFAAGFSATLAYHRMAADNELLACHAGGVGHRTLLTPAALSGVVMAIVLATLSSEVIPKFLRGMQQLVTEDATRLMVAEINRGQAVQMEDNTLVYADSVERLPPDSSGAAQRLWLRGVLVVKLDDNGQVEVEGTAREAFVWFFPAGSAERRTLVQMHAREFLGRKRGEATTESSMDLQYSVPNAFADDPKFYGFRELRSLRRRPEALPQIDSQRRWLATMLAERATVGQIQSSLQLDANISMRDSLDQPVVLRASNLEWDDARKWYRILPDTPGGPVEFERMLDGGRSQIQQSRSAWLRSLPSVEAGERGVSFEVRMEDVTTMGSSSDPTIDSGGAVTGQKLNKVVSGLTVSANPGPEYFSKSAVELLELADQRVAEFDWDTPVREPRDKLRTRIENLMREITSKQHERLAMSVACLVMVLTGAVMAVRLRDGMPLHVYLWSFFPALAAVLSISAGQQLVHQHGLPGLSLLWGGVAALSLFTFFEYRRMARH
ncbi:MAG: LptF/LptG family permease [Phycisphaerales bacterium]|nr:LptF/LptG family permease [Phycisphaerales bacterium]